MPPSKRSEKSSARATDATIVFHPLTAERWADLEVLFGARGACGGCWCMTWRLPRARFEKGKGVGNRAAFRRRVQAGPSYRARGLSVKLLQAAVKMAGKAGAEVVEGYPVVPYAPHMPDAFAWTGTLAAFRAAGFEEVARGSPKRPIVRAETRPATR